MKSWIFGTHLSMLYHGHCPQRSQSCYHHHTGTSLTCLQWTLLEHSVSPSVSQPFGSHPPHWPGASGWSTLAGHWSQFSVLTPQYVSRWSPSHPSSGPPLAGLGGWWTGFLSMIVLGFLRNSLSTPEMTWLPKTKKEFRIEYKIFCLQYDWSLVTHEP